MYPKGRFTNVARRPTFVSGNYRNLDEGRGWVTGVPVEPLTTALTLAEAVRVDVAAFRTLGASIGVIRSLVERGFQI